MRIEFKPSPALAALMGGRPIAAFDVETTGLDRNYCRVVEAALAVVEPNGPIWIESRMFSGGISSPEAYKAHGIPDSARRHLPSFEEVWVPKLEKLLDGHMVAGHNIVHFDLPFVKAKGANFKEMAAADTYRMAKTLGLKDNSLGSLCSRYKLPVGGHRAAGDVSASVHLLNHFLNGMYPKGEAPGGMSIFDDLVNNGMVVAPGYVPGQR